MIDQELTKRNLLNCIDEITRKVAVSSIGYGGKRALYDMCEYAGCIILETNIKDLDSYKRAKKTMTDLAMKSGGVILWWEMTGRKNRVGTIEGVEND